MERENDYNIVRFISLVLFTIICIIVQALCPLAIKIVCWICLLLFLDLTACKIYLKYKETKEKYYWCTFKYQFKDLLWKYNLFRYIKNFFFCLRFPFWKSRNVWTGEYSGYSSTWYDAIPAGWRKAFGIKLSKDIKQAFKKDKKVQPKLKWEDALFWSDIKEKYGTLRLYAAATSNIMKVLGEYEDLSENYCINCGKPAEYITSGWISYLCHNCFMEHCNHINFDNLEDCLNYVEEHEIKKD